MNTPCAGELQFWEVSKSALVRIAKALERIADALEKRDKETLNPEMATHVIRQTQLEADNG